MEYTRIRRLLHSAAMIVSTIWMVVVIYFEFFAAAPGQFGFDTPEMEQKLGSCSGTFMERYRCKDGLIIEKGQEDFLIWIEKITWVFGLPAILFGALRLTRRTPDDDDDEYDSPALLPPPTDINRWRVR